MESKESIRNLYYDIQQRTNGEIYIGVVGPVRTGKSTFIKSFMEEMVLPAIEDENQRKRTMDEMPQSGAGKTITTTEPKFIPREAVNISVTEDISLKVRLIDCVGYLVEGAGGHMEGEKERMVTTPWFSEQIPFEKAAQIGTDKVITDHSTIGVVVTTDGSIGDIARENYVDAEEKTILALKKLKKPFVILVNSKKPYAQETKKLVSDIREKYGVSVMAVNCMQLKKEDIHNIIKQVLYEFPLSCMEFYMPAWMEMLKNDHPLKLCVLEQVKGMMEEYHSLQDVIEKTPVMENEYIKSCYMEKLDLATGVLRIQICPKEQYYYDMLTEIMGEEIHNEYELMNMLRDFGTKKEEYVKISKSIENVREFGYSMIMPTRDEINLGEPELIHHGNKFGVKIKASSPSIHMIRANIETEIAPIVGEQNQAEDLIQYINSSKDQKLGIWNTNIFGKSVEQLISDGIASKTAEIGEECQQQLQDTMQKIVNDKKGGMVCIIL